MKPHPSLIGASRRGGVYLLALVTGMVITGMVITALALTSSQRARVQLAEQTDGAHSTARSGLEIGAAMLAADPEGAAWRADVGPYTAISAAALGDASLTLSFLDPVDAKLSNSIGDPVELQADATLGGARQVLAARFLPTRENLPVLSSPLWAGGALQFSGATVFGSVAIGSNTSATATSSAITAPVKAPVITGGTYAGGTRVVSAVRLPADSVIDSWVAKAVTMTWPGGDMNKLLLGPNYNPVGGGVSADGIYVINCANRKIRIRNCRIVGTLILLDPKSDSIIDKSNSFEARCGQPTLLIRGSMQVSMDSSDLRESQSGVNYNPPSVPSRGNSNSSTTDSYASQIAGVVYATRDLTLDTATTVDGVVLAAGTITLRDRVTLRWSPVKDPIDGFDMVQGFAVQPGSVRRVVP